MTIPFPHKRTSMIMYIFPTGAVPCIISELCLWTLLSCRSAPHPQSPLTSLPTNIDSQIRLARSPLNLAVHGHEVFPSPDPF